MAVKTESTDKQEESAILGVLKNISGQLDGLERRMGDMEVKVKQQDMRTAKFQPMQPPDGVKKPRPQLEQLQRAEQYANDGKSLPVSASGRLMAYAQVLYPEGTIVRFNPESEVYQRLKKAHEERKARFDPDMGEGVIITTHFINSDYGVKYRVRFDKLTAPRGDGFYETELIPA